MRASVRLLFLIAFVSSAGCGPAVDLTWGLQVNIVNSGWFDAGIVNGQNKLVPSVKIRVKNLSDQSLGSLQVNATFLQASGKELDEVFKTVAGSQGLAPGATSETVIIKSPHGYTGTEPRLYMMKNSQFVDAKVKLLAKYGSIQWVPIGEYPIERKLIVD